MRIAAALALVVAAIATGCTSPGTSAGSEQPPEPTEGGSALTVQWTIRGSSDPSVCDQASAAAIQITILTNRGEPFGSFQQSCNAFSTNLDLDPGVYAMQAQLLDAAGAPRTRLVRIETFTLNVNSQLTEPIDFGVGTFLTAPPIE
jgi:hypothetical protein